ncbi:Complement receptor type 2 [Phytophthora citrophthora]|uniref:Complement receptor type 2 n=1 Tax=Phytophthora citrophthora TaxID=4793 RepID=A0AAD9GV24_9STRA|nr:Complement receptor type 2 [Phytophthora citrophthora]
MGRFLRFVAFAVALTTIPSTDAGNLRGSDKVPTYNCGAPASIYQGSVKFSSTSPGSSATYTCMKGTTMRGPATVRCTNQGVWSPQTPECRVTYSLSKDNTYRNHDTGYQLYSG